MPISNPNEVWNNIGYYIIDTDRDSKSAQGYFGFFQYYQIFIECLSSYYYLIRFFFPGICYRGTRNYGFQEKPPLIVISHSILYHCVNLEMAIRFSLKISDVRPISKLYWNWSSNLLKKWLRLPICDEINLIPKVRTVVLKVPWCLIFHYF